MQQRVREKENIEILFNTVTMGLFGEEVLEGAHLAAHKGTDNENFYDIAIDGFFLAIGHQPNTEVFLGAVDLDEGGYIKVAQPTTATSAGRVRRRRRCRPKLPAGHLRRRHGLPRGPRRRTLPDGARLNPDRPDERTAGRANGPAVIFCFLFRLCFFVSLNIIT